MMARQIAQMEMTKPLLFVKVSIQMNNLYVHYSTYVHGYLFSIFIISRLAVVSNGALIIL